VFLQGDRQKMLFTARDVLGLLLGFDNLVKLSAPCICLLTWNSFVPYNSNLLLRSLFQNNAR